MLQSSPPQPTSQQPPLSSRGRPPMPATPATPTRGGSVQAAGESPSRGRGVLGEFRDFMLRGASGAAPPTPTRGAQQQQRNRAQAAGTPAVAALRHWFASWMAARDANADQARIAFAQLLQQQQSCDPPEGVDSATMLEASFVLEGVEVLVKLAVTGANDLATGSSSTVDIAVVGAETKCRWPLAARRVASVARATSGRPLEEFLDLLLDSFHVETPQPPSPNASLTGSCDVSLADAPAGCRGASPRSASPQGRRRRSSMEETRSPGSGCSRGGDSDNATDAGAAAEPGLASSFADWCRARPPLLRFQHASRGMGWDFPLSKAEKHEMLLLQIFAQEAERRERELQVMQRRASCEPSSSGSGRRSRSSEAATCRSRAER